MCNENVFKYQIQEMIPVDYSYDGNQRLEFWNSVKLDDSSGHKYEIVLPERFWNNVKLDDSSGISQQINISSLFWNNVKLDDSSGSNYTITQRVKIRNNRNNLQR